VIVLGLTGSIGMGKTTTAALFAARGIPVWNADDAVAALYGPGGDAVAPLAALFPDAVRDGVVDRAALRDVVSADPDRLRALEAAVHPLVARDRDRFLAAGAPVVLLDVPLLFETGLDAACDRTVVVSTAPDLQRARVFARGTMSAAQLDAILARQMPDADKRARADYIVDTTTHESARRDVDAILRELPC
jgi:dephospho-CoA kinase